MEAVSANANTIGIIRINFPIKPGRSINGKKAAMFVPIEDKIGETTSEVPFIAA